MAANFHDWLEKDLERRSATQRTQIEAAKLVATLAVATAAAFIASALQSGHSRTQEAMIVGAMRGNYDGEKELKELEQATIVSVLNNDAIVRQVKTATGVTLLLAATAAAFVVASLL